MHRISWQNRGGRGDFPANPFFIFSVLPADLRRTGVCRGRRKEKEEQT
jgi:hypothetical protein